MSPDRALLEEVAMVQAKKRGDSMWDVFWKRGEPFEHNSDERSPELIELSDKPGEVFMASIWGMSFSWTLVVSTALGFWMMAAPVVLGLPIKATAADVNHLGGALIVVMAVISMGEVVRTGRYLNVLFGLAVAVWLWFVADSKLALDVGSAVSGLLVAGLSPPKGLVREKYGFWDKYIK